MTKTPKQQAQEMAEKFNKSLVAICQTGDGADDKNVIELVLKELDLEQLIKDSLRLKGLRELMGYVQNGSDATVTLFQDDATSTYFVQAGKLSEFDDSFNGAIDKAISTAMKEGE